MCNISSSGQTDVRDCVSFFLVGVLSRESLWSYALNPRRQRCPTRALHLLLACILPQYKSCLNISSAVAAYSLFARFLIIYRASSLRFSGTVHYSHLIHSIFVVSFIILCMSRRNIRSSHASREKCHTLFRDGSRLPPTTN